MDRLDYDNVKGFLNTKYMGRNIAYFDKITSTNDIAKKLGDEGEKEGLIVISEEQTKGRGRMGRKWSTHKGDAIAMTLLLRPNIPPKDAPSITPLLALSIVEGIKDLTGIECGIKWPNDVVLDGKKLSGILTEMKLSGAKINYIAAGIGININQSAFEDEIADIATSLKRFSGLDFNRARILGEILNSLEKNYEEFKANGISVFIEKLKKYSVLIGQRVRIELTNEKIEGKVVDMGEDGSLIISNDNGELKRVISGEVSLSWYYKAK